MKDGAPHPDNLMIARPVHIRDQSPDAARWLEPAGQLRAGHDFLP